jgi:hypothetical protein
LCFQMPGELIVKFNTGFTGVVKHGRVCAGTEIATMPNPKDIKRLCLKPLNSS